MGKRGSPIKSDPVVHDSDDDELNGGSPSAIGGSSKPPPAKKVRVDDKSAEASGSAEVKKNGQGETYVELGSRKRATVRKFKDIVLVDIREYYLDKGAGEEKPGKKGISLTLEQFKELKKGLDEVSKAAEALR